jgi:hypothetical protein
MCRLSAEFVPCLRALEPVSERCETIERERLIPLGRYPLGAAA